MTVGYVGSSDHHTLYDYDATALGQITGAPQNSLVNSVNTFGSQGKSNNNMLLAGLKHQFSHTFAAKGQMPGATAWIPTPVRIFATLTFTTRASPMGGRIST